METSRGADPGPGLDPWPAAVLEVREVTGSTMDDALALALSGCASGSAVLAGFQQKGRGRVPGRTWLSPPWESMLATIILRREDIPFAMHELPLRAGLAAARAVEEAAGISVQIKWPNDLVWQGRKLAGILCESRGPAALVGVGVNCAQASFPPGLAMPACSILQAGGRGVDPRALLSVVLRRLREVMDDQGWRGELVERLYARGTRVVVDLLGSGRVREGVLQYVDEEGRIVLMLDGGELVAIAQGEIRTGP
jgi:BirA family transcriptional regulator, biotin operon repressor / biotin---[acetyl-CoA-carboxylase] ligase